MAVVNGVSGSTLAVLLCIFVYKFLVYPAFLSPLSRIPHAHPLARFTPAWILYIRYTSRELATIHAAHRRLGPVIRLSPNELSVNCVKGGIQAVYAGGLPKHEWYANAFENYGVSNMFSTTDNKPHSVRKRIISNIYSKSYLQSSAMLAAVTKEIVHGRLLPKLGGLANSDDGANVSIIFNSTTFDFVSAYLFGLECSSRMLNNDKAMHSFLELCRIRALYNRYFWMQELPGLTRLLERLRIYVAPKSVWAAHYQIEAMGMGYSRRAEVQLAKMGTSSVANVPDRDAGDFPLVYAQLVNALGNPSQLMKEGAHDVESIRKVLASELMDHMIAGFETSGITLVYLAHELSQRPDLQRALRRELLTLDPPIEWKKGQGVATIRMPSPKALDALPLLEAILRETLRLHCPIPGPQPRATPPGGCTLGPSGEFGQLPGGVRISAQAWSLHRKADVFPEPESWRPERWLRKDGQDVEQKKEMDRWFWAFGSGGRMCVGSNLANYRKSETALSAIADLHETEIKHIVAALYTNFATSIINDDGIEQVDAYTAPPKSDTLVLKLESWDRAGS